MRGWIAGLWIGLALSSCTAQRLLLIRFPEDITGLSPFPRLSKNGQVVVTDFSFPGINGVVPALWIKGVGWRYLRADGGLTTNPQEAMIGCMAYDCSYDGRVVVGDARRIFRWRLGVGVEDLAPPAGQPPPLYMSVWRVSWDGAFVVGKVFYRTHFTGGLTIQCAGMQQGK